MSKQLVVTRLISAVEKNLHTTGHMIVDGMALGMVRMQAGTAARKFIAEKGIDDLQMTYLDGLTVDDWFDRLIGTYDVQVVIDLVYAVFDTYWDSNKVVCIK